MSREPIRAHRQNVSDYHLPPLTFSAVGRKFVGKSDLKGREIERGTERETEKRKRNNRNTEKRKTERLFHT